jgi:hypothetical protein
VEVSKVVLGGGVQSDIESFEMLQQKKKSEAWPGDYYDEEKQQKQNSDHVSNPLETGVGLSENITPNSQFTTTVMYFA